MNLKPIKSIIFDCDGVLLNSNKLKTQAFYTAALPYGTSAADELVAYHRQHGGVSRFEKFNYFLDKIVSSHRDGPKLESILDVYKTEVKKGLLNCKLAPGLKALRDQTPEACWMIVSGGVEDELRDLFNERDIAEYFDSGIYGSPETKEIIVERLVEEKKIISPCLFLGDSKYDHEVSKKAGAEFIFVSAWTEFSDWRVYCDRNGIESIKQLDELLHNDIHNEYSLEYSL